MNATPVPASGALRYAKVAIGRPLDQPYTYLIPERLSAGLQVGSLVEVPLKNDLAGGVVIDIANTADVPARVRGQIKPIKRRLSPEYCIRPEIIEMARWIAGYYFCSIGEALSAVSMVGLNDVAMKTELRWSLAEPERWLRTDFQPLAAEKPPTPARRRVIDALLASNAPMTAAELKTASGAGDGVLKPMLECGWLKRVQEAVLRRDEDAEEFERLLAAEAEASIDADADVLAPGITLTPRQAKVRDTLFEALHTATFQPFLLHGVTGSGKTEIYLRLIAEALRIGRTAIVLVPEIALTPQIVDAFRRRLGKLVGVYHSKLSLGQKLDLDRLIAANEVRVVIGARSALFSPLPSLGVVIVDEEHETSYKQSETPRYHARDAALVRAQKAGAVAVLGSATPSIESLHNAREGKYKRLSLPDRVGPHASPRMIVVDMKRHIRQSTVISAAPGFEGIDAILSPTLREAIALRLERGEQTVLLLNRRGFANHVLCLKCEKQVQCPNCDVALTYHKTIDRLLCHWCGHRQPVPEACPHCQAHEIKVLGFGTQKIEEAIEAVFPAARKLRVDLDSMRRKGAFREAWRKINGRKIDIILGTQMIAKGLHLEAVTLVGVISADFALGLPDFRAAERTYQLLTQVAGRAGRGNVAGEVILQSFMPHHYAIDCAARLAESEFYERELRNREMLRFPPFSRLAALLVSGPDESLVRDQAHKLGGILKRLVYRAEHLAVKILGPTPAPIARIENQYRWRLLARGAKPGPLHDVLKEGLKLFAPEHKKSQINLTVDIDPMDLM